MRGSIKLFSVLGIPVDINATWLIAVAIITWSLSTTAYPSFFQMWSTTEYWIAGIVTTLLLFTSVLLHELGHSIVALSQGLKVRGITLLLFGGVSRIQGEASRPRNEFLMAFAGPAVSLVLGVGLLFWWFAFRPDFENQITPLHGIVFFTGWMNILVAGFNMLPGYPMDGGRVLRSAVWGLTGDTRRASRVANRVGRVVFYLLIAWGAWQIVNGDIMGGIWIIMIGWFLMSSAKGEARGEQAQQEASSLDMQDRLNFRVGVATRALPPMIEGAWSVEQVMTRGLPENPTASIPVAKQGELIGFIVRHDLADVSILERGRVTVGELMDPGSLRVVSINDPLREALRLMDMHRLHQLVVMDSDYVAGMVTRQDIVAAMVEFQSAGESTGPRDDGTPV